MSTDFDITDNEKAIEDILNKFEKEKILNRKSEILKKISSGNISKEELEKLENELKSLIVKWLPNKVRGWKIWWIRKRK